MPHFEELSHSQLNAPAASMGSRQGWFRRLWHEIELPLLILLGVASIVLGVVGFQLYFATIPDEGGHFNIFRSLYAALELLEFQGGNLRTPLPWELEVARWLAPAVTTYAVLMGLAAIFRNYLQAVRLQFTSRHVVICGLGQKGLLLAKNFRTAGKTVAVIEKDGGNPSIPVCRDLGIMVIAGDARDVDSLRKAGVRQADSLIAVCGDDGANADIAVKARQVVATRKGRKLNCAIHISDPRLWVFLRQQEFGSEKTNAFRLDFFNIYDHGARQLLAEYPLQPKTSEKTEKAPHLLIVGMGNLGEQIVLHAARKWATEQAENRHKLHISVVDPEAQQKIDKLCQEYSLVKNTCQWKAYPLDFDCPEFHHASFLDSKRGESSLTYIFVCLDDETMGLSSALSLLNQTQNTDVPILVRLTEDAGLASLLHGAQAGTGGFSRMHVFGLMERTCRPALLNDGSHAALARVIHAQYIRNETREGNTPETNHSLVGWDALSEDLKEMNREQADDIGLKLKAVGCDILPWNDYAADRFAFTPDEIEQMAKMEHKRWVAQKLAQGWKYGAVREAGKKEHPSMVDWEDARFSEAEKEKDRNTVRQIPGYLALAGFQIYRIS